MVRRAYQSVTKFFAALTHFDLATLTHQPVHFPDFPSASFRRRTPGPPPFSSMNSTPAAFNAADCSLEPEILFRNNFGHACEYGLRYWASCQSGSAIGPTSVDQFEDWYKSVTRAQPVLVRRLRRDRRIHRKHRRG